MHTDLSVEERRAAVRKMALSGNTRQQIQNTLHISYNTVRSDLKILNIIPVSPYKKKDTNGRL